MPRGLSLSIGRRLVLLIGDEGALLMSVGGGTELRRFAARYDDGPEVDAIRRALEAEPKTPLCILLDHLDQTYRRETLPRINPLDQQKVVRRRLEMTFPGSRMRGALKLPVDPGRRQQRPYLFVAAAETGDMANWLKLVDGAPNPILRMGLLPLESAALVARIAQIDREAAGPRTWYALITWQRTGGFRQIIVRNGQLEFTRLTPPLETEATGPAIAASVERDLRSSLGYLTRLGFKEGDVLRLVVAAPERAHAAIGQLRIAGETPTPVTPQAFAQRMGIKVKADPQYADLLHAAWYAQRRTPALLVAPRAVAERRTVEQAAIWSLRAALLVLAAAALYASYLGTMAVQDDRDYVEKLPQRGQAERRVREARAALGDYAIPVETVRGTIQLDEELGKRDASPWPTLRALAGALGPEERLEHLDWRPVEDAAPGEGEAEGPPPMGALLRITLFGTQDRAVAVARTDALRERLAAALPEKQVDVRRHPVPVQPGQILTGGGAVGVVQPPGRLFDAELFVRDRAP